MANLQKTLDALQPYVISIRYLEGVPVVDVIFKDGWTLPESDVIKRVKGDEGLNYYMLFSEKDTIGLDELLAYVDLVIKFNVEREKKHELLKERVNELKELFKKIPLTKLKRLKFSFSDEELVPELEDFNLTEETNIPPATSKSSNIEDTENASVINVEEVNTQQEEYSEEEAEIIEEEQRAENYRKIKMANSKNEQVKNILQNIELPPKKLIQNTLTIEGDCNCGPDEACSKCIEQKDL